MLGHISKFDGNNSLIKHDVVQGNNKLDLDLLRNFNAVSYTHLRAHETFRPQSRMPSSA